MKILTTTFSIAFLKTATARLAISTEAEKDRELSGGGCFTGTMTELPMSDVVIPGNYEDGRKLTGNQPEPGLFNPGDLLTWSENPLCRGHRMDCGEKNSRSLVGYAQGYCVGLPNSAAECSDTWIFNDEDILTVRGPDFTSQDPPEGVLPVVGGSGCYKNARGYIKASFNSDDNVFIWNLSKVTHTN
mmetsp:Transcript_8497/g.11694  ORF Transcript_8497/g.11694 Transcript_8497/m.11694 type:complete len:187 (-) Transcript_8497:114-674(-)